MSDYWAENLRECAIEGIEIPVSGRSISGGHEFGRHRYQGRRGQDTEPTGGAPLSISIETELFASVDPAYYPIRYTELLAILTDEDLGGHVTFVDPVFGELPMQVVQWGATEDAGKRSGAVVKIQLEERSTDTLSLTAPIVVQRPASQATATARRLDMALPSVGVFEEHVFSAFASSGYPVSGAELGSTVGALLSTVVGTVIDRFSASYPAIDTVRGELDRMRARCDALLSLPQINAAEAWDTRRTIVVLCDAVAQAGLEAVGRRGTEAEHVVTAEHTTAQAIAGATLGDPTRWPEIVAANGSIRNPLRVARGPVRVYLPRRGRGAGLHA